MKRHKDLFLFTIIIFIAVVPYLNSLPNPFIWDEEVIIIGNPIIKAWRYLPLIFKTDIFGGQIMAGGFYRPIYMLSFVLDYHIWKLNATGYHLFSVIFHIINVILLYILILKIGLDKKVAWLSALFFALFPVNCEAVSLIAARVELILGFLLLLSTIVFLDGIKKMQFYFLVSIFLFVLAIFTKESALIFPLIMFIYSAIFLDKDKRRKTRPPLFVFGGVLFIYLILRLLVLGNPFHRTLSLINEASLLERIYTLPRILLTYIRLIVFPFILKSEYHFVVHTFKNPYVWLGTLGLISIFSLILKSLKPRRHALFFSCWFLIGLLPYSNLIIPLHATLMEHWAYFSSMGFAVLMSMAIFKITEKMLRWQRHVSVAIIAFLMIFYAVRITERNKEWRDPFVLYQRDLEREPNSFLLHCNLGVEYFRKGMMKEAKKEFLASNDVCPGRGYDIAYNNLGVIYAREGKISDAISCYKTSIALNNYALAYGNLGALYNNLQMHKDAALILQEGAKLYPLDVEIKRQLDIAQKNILK